METRRAKRLKASFKVKLKVDTSLTQHLHFQKDSIDVVTLDISTLGAGLLSKYFIPKGVIVDLKLNIDNKTVQTKGEIMSAVSGGKGLTRLGIKFIDLDKNQLKIIENFIKKNERRSQPRLELS